MINHTANDNAYIERLKKEVQFNNDAYDHNYHVDNDE